MADTIERHGSSEELDPFALLWRATPEDDRDTDPVRAQMAQPALVIHAERV